MPDSELSLLNNMEPLKDASLVKVIKTFIFLPFCRFLVILCPNSLGSWWAPQLPVNIKQWTVAHPWAGNPNFQKQSWPETWALQAGSSSGASSNSCSLNIYSTFIYWRMEAKTHPLLIKKCIQKLSLLLIHFQQCRHSQYSEKQTAKSPPFFCNCYPLSCFFCKRNYS